MKISGFEVRGKKLVVFGLIGYCSRILISHNVICMHLYQIMNFLQL
jgi:hypothetical protein